ncbi:MAG: DUF2600 family protein [Solirubrobacteraceae bacterium]
MSPPPVATFAGTALRYWLTVFPRTRRELRHWRRRAALIGDPALRRLALEALAKRGNVEGAAAFAAFAPWRRRREVVRALVAFQCAYDYADVLDEQPSADPVGDGRRVHEALLAAVDLDAPHRDYYSRFPGCDDGGYLQQLLDACRASFRGLPSHAAVAAPARAAAARIVAFQSLSLGAPRALERWALTCAPAGSGLAWWESAAAAGSSLAVHALIAAAAKPATATADLAAIEGAYFPWVGALHSLLDSLVDQAEDAATGQLSLIGCYPSPRDAAPRMRWLAECALQQARALPDGRRHAILVTAVACNYLSTPGASQPDAVAVAQAVRGSLGGLAAPTLLIFRARHLGGRLARALAGTAAGRWALTGGARGGGERGVDARAA